MLKKTNSQFSIEFIVLIAFMFFIFLTFIAVITSKVLESKEAETQTITEDVATLVTNEIDLAKAATDGYARTFEIPNKINGIEYDIEIIDNRELVVTYLGKEYVSFLPEKVVGDINKGLNRVKRIGGVVYLQYTPECDDEVDNDADGKIDFPDDSGCTKSEDNDETNCGDGVCEEIEDCVDCEADCGKCLRVVLMKDIENAVSFRENGDMVLKGTLKQNEVELNPAGGQDEFVFKDSTGNAVAIIRLQTGNMFIKGSLFENQLTLTPSAASNDFVVKNSTGDVVSYINEDGNLYVKGTLKKGRP